MIFLKNYFASTTKEIDIIPIIHDVHFAIRDSQIPDGLVTITIPGSGAGLLVTSRDKKELENAKEKLKHLEGINLSLSIPFQKKELILEAQQIIYLVDFADSGKRREFYVQVIGDAPPAAQQPTARRHQP